MTNSEKYAMIRSMRKVVEAVQQDRDNGLLPNLFETHVLLQYIDILERGVGVGPKEIPVRISEEVVERKFSKYNFGD